MWEWLFGRKRPSSSTEPCAPESEHPSELPSGTKAPMTIGAIVDEMKAKEYQGPFANMCDGILAVMFHGPGVSLEPRWIEPADNPFQMHVLDCREFCLHSPLFVMGKEAQSVEAQFKQARDDPSNFWHQTVPDAERRACLLSYPRSEQRISDGPQFVAERMEDLWNIFLCDGHFYFTRSWTGELRYRAKVLFRDGAIFVTEVETSRAAAARILWPKTEDVEIPIKQVDFLIKALLYPFQVPAPLPRGLHPTPGRIALFTLSEYGRWGWFPTFDDTTEYRISLNGVVGRFPSPPNHAALLSALCAVENESDPGAKLRLYNQLHNSNLYLSFVVPQDIRAAIQAGTATFSSETPVEISTEMWEEEQCCFAFSDPAYRITQGGGCFAFKGTELCAKVLREYDAGMVINPAGPGTCRLTRSELEMLAQSA
jgi:SseB protein N-terminal domain